MTKDNSNPSGISRRGFLAATLSALLPETIFPEIIFQEPNRKGVSDLLNVEPNRLLYIWFSFYVGNIVDDTNRRLGLLDQLRNTQSIPPDKVEDLASDIACANPLTAESRKWLHAHGRSLITRPITDEQIRFFFERYKAEAGDLLYRVIIGNRDANEAIAGLLRCNKLAPLEMHDLLENAFNHHSHVCRLLERELDRFPELRTAVDASKMRQAPQNSFPAIGTRHREYESPIPHDYYEGQQANSWHERLIEQTASASAVKTKAR